jgi:hypothetical protein
MNKLINYNGKIYGEYFYWRLKLEIRYTRWLLHSYKRSENSTRAIHLIIF